MTFAIACGHGDFDPFPVYGFEACFELPKKRPDDGCGFDNGGPTSRAWIDGPHAGFDEMDSSRLALESLEWFERSIQASEWRENPTARLALSYPSDSLSVTAFFAPELDLTWEEQLRTWFERYPPSARGRSQLADEGYQWAVEFGDRGRVRGTADSDSMALEAMRSAEKNDGTTRIFEEPSFSLGFTVRRSSHEMDCYFADADSAEQIDQLPRLLREKRAQNGGS